MKLTSRNPRPLTTAEQLKKVGQCLYRHEGNEKYYGRKKFRGSKSPTLHCLETTDRRLAERKLADWIRNRAGATSGDISFAGLCEKFLETKAGRAEGTLKNFNLLIDKFRNGFSYFNTPIIKIKPLEYSAFVASLKLAPNYNNKMVETLAAILQVGVDGGFLVSHPLSRELKKGLRKKWNRRMPKVPTVEQAEKIIANMVNDASINTRQSSKDFLAFLFYAGIGEAELRAMNWRDIDWDKERIEIPMRVKTGEYFYVPFYGWLKPFLLDLHTRRGKPSRGPIFNIKSVKQGIWNVCKRLGYPKYSPRNFRQACIVRLLWIDGIDPADVAKWQGHVDGGVLIQRVYSQVISDAHSDREKQQIAKTFAAAAPATP